ncbi:unnamed protein product [Vicia faba]|uniref:Ubiquitin-like protease family profile domain-containing protein n=1 Tax=Vicia faba TaxID=3906 RepID=A0AAV1A5G4_VICFA|nr:unnamed protein product [Vicia faba]
MKYLLSDIFALWNFIYVSTYDAHSPRFLEFETSESVSRPSSTYDAHSPRFLEFETSERKCITIASKPAYPYKKGRLGYARLQEKILEETQSDETSLPAHVLWKEARVGRDKVVNPDLQHIYDGRLYRNRYPRRDKERYMAERSSSQLKETSDKASINRQKNFPEGISCYMNALLPVPDIVAETTLLRDAVGSFVAWPSDLICIDDQTPAKPASKDKGILQRGESIASQRQVPSQDQSQHVSQKGSRVPPKKKVPVRKFVPRTTASTKSLYLLPYNTGCHWLLLAINPIKEVVYYLNSVDGDWTNYPEMKLVIDTSIQVFRCQRGARVPRSRSNNINWIKVQCPQQQNGIDCGYFVLMFIKEIIQMYEIEIPITYFDQYNCPYYSPRQLEELKEELCQYFIELRIL